MALSQTELVLAAFTAALAVMFMYSPYKPAETGAHHCETSEPSLSFIWDSTTPFQASSHSVEVASFITLQASALRVSRSTQLWNATVHSAWDDLCEPGSEPSAKCRPYLYSDFRRAVLSILDVAIATEILGQSATCLGNIDTLRALVINYDDATNGSPPLEWWRQRWFPTAVAAFSCGFNDECYRPAKRSRVRKLNVFNLPYEPDPVALPADVAVTYRNDVRTRMVWRLVRPYLTSNQKARESSTAWTDNDIGLYVPFFNTNLDDLPPDSSTTYKEFVMKTNAKTLRYHTKGKVRSSYTIFFGPATWHLWHVIAERIAEADELGGDNIDTDNGGNPLVHDAQQRELVALHQSMVIAVGSVLPCPYCRSHFLNKVSNNDIFSIDGHSEAGLYPLPYLYADDTGTLNGKLAAVTNGRQLRGFMIGLHNAVSSSVQRSRSCSVTELYDTPSDGPGADPQFDCGVTTTLKNAQQIQAETPPTEKVTWKGNLQELRVLHLLMHATHAGEDEIGIDEHVVLATMGSWPYSYRWGLRLGTPGSFETVRAQSKAAVARLKSLDSNALRWEHWTKRRTHDGISAEETVHAAEYSSASGRIQEAGDEGDAHHHFPVDPQNDHAEAVAVVRALSANLTNILVSAMVMKQYKLSDREPFNTKRSTAVEGQPDAVFAPCTVAKRIAALQRGEGLLGLLGLKGPWDRSAPVCADN